MTLVAALAAALVAMAVLPRRRLRGPARRRPTVERIERRWHARRQRREARADATRLAFGLAAELRAGRTPAEALAALAAQLPALESHVIAVAQAVGRGADLGDELDQLAAQADVARLRPIAAAWTATAGLGAGVADVLERLGESFEAADRCAEELSAAAAGPRATVAVLVALPLLGLALGGSLGLAPLHVLLHTRTGAVLAAGAVLLDVVGLLWVRRILAAATPP